VKRLTPLLIVIILAGFLRPFSVSAQGDPVVYMFTFEGSGSGSAQGWFYDEMFAQQPGTTEGFEVSDGITAGLTSCDTYCLKFAGTEAAQTFTTVYSFGNDVEIQNIRFYWENKTEGIGAYLDVLVYDSAMSVNGATVTA
jgi:hypothetical protein